METSGIRRFASEKTLFYLTSGILLLLPVVEIITALLSRYSKDFTPAFFQPLVFGAFGVLGTIAVIIYKPCELKSQETRGEWYPADLFYLVLVLFMILSAVFSTNPGVYSFGYIYCCENPVDFLGYFFMFFAGSKIRSFEYRKKLVITLLIVEVVHGIFAFLETFNILIVLPLLIWHSGAAYGLTPNSNYYGGLAVFMLACASGVYLFSEIFSNKKALRVVSALFAGFVFYTMMGSRARLAWVGFAAMLAFYLISGVVMLKGNIDRAELKRYFIRFAILCLVFAAVFAVTHVATDFISEEVTRTQMEVDGKLNNGLGSDRLLLWQCGLESVPRHWATGIGLDNFRQVFYEKYGQVEKGFFVDQAHNEFLQVLVTQGVFAFAAYMFLYIRTVLVNVKKIFKGEDESSRALNWVFLAMVVTYLAQSFFNCSVISVAPHFWLALGLLNTCDRPINLFNKNN